MDLEIEDRLNKIYKNLIIEVAFKEFRIYNIHIFNSLSDGIDISFDYTYDCHLTFDSNISIIIYMIDRFIIDYYKRGE